MAEHLTSDYQNKACRCDPCTVANRIRQADYMNRHPEQRLKRRMDERLRRGLTMEHALKLEARYVEAPGE